MAGILVFFWEGPFSGAMLVLGRVSSLLPQNIQGCMVIIKYPLNCGKSTAEVSCSMKIILHMQVSPTSTLV